MSSQLERFKQLASSDRAYREVLTTVASLGATASANRLARATLAVAGATLLTAIVTLLVVKADPGPPIQTIRLWIEHHI